MDGETAVVTGASRGIGAAVARRFAEDGAHVVICARDADALEAVAAEITGADGTVTTLRADVRDEFDIERLMERAACAGDGIDTVVANAGIYHGDPGETPLSGESYAAFDDHLRTNVRGVFATVREAVPHLAPGARVLVTSGRIAREQAAGDGSYAVSKAAAEAVAAQFAAVLDCPVGVVDPGRVATDLADGDGFDPADVAEQFRWAARDADPDAVDGAVIDRRDWREATR